MAFWTGTKLRNRGRFGSRPNLKALAASFRRERSGVAAVEFALLAFWFFLIVFAILETAFVFIGEMTLDQATERAGRLVRTGQVANAKWSEAEFKEELCDEIPLLLSCEKINFDLKIYSNFDAIPAGAPVINGVLDKSSFGYEPGKAGLIMALRTFYQWPLYTDIFRRYLSDMEDGSHLMMSVVIFRTEPFTTESDDDTSS